MARPFPVPSVDVQSSNLVMMMTRRIGFANVTSEFVSICFRLAVRRLRSLCWASIVCGTLSSQQPDDISPADNPGAEIRWGQKSAQVG